MIKIKNLGIRVTKDGSKRTGDYTQRDLAKQYKVVRSTIYFIIDNKICKI